MLTKAVWTSEGDRVRISLPIAKVDKERRTVSGFATLDNVDTQGDKVSAEASKRAFARWRGNVREMHAPIAVGKVLSFRDEEFYDANDDKLYRGIFVTAYVSKGAQDTWEKVLDGTLTGFSIGGEILEKRDVMGKSEDGAQREIVDYDLIELSLVDNPANQLANIFSIQKSKDGTFMKGLAVDVRTENIFWCNTDEFSVLSTEESVDCVQCGVPMENIGWVESEADDKAEKVRSTIEKVSGLSKGGVIAPNTFTYNGNTGTSTTGSYTITINSTTAGVDATAIGKQIAEQLKGGVTVAKASTKNNDAAAADAQATEAAQADENAQADASADNTGAEDPNAQPNTGPDADGSETLAEANGDAAEETAEADEAADANANTDVQDTSTATEVETAPAEAKPDAVAAATGPDANQALAQISEQMAQITQAVTGVQASVEETVKGVDTRVSDLATQVESLRQQVETVSKAVEVVNDSTAVRKSSDLGGSGDTTDDSNTKESFWRGSFLGVNRLTS